MDKQKQAPLPKTMTVGDHGPEKLVIRREPKVSEPVFVRGTIDPEVRK